MRHKYTIHDERIHQMHLFQIEYDKLFHAGYGRWRHLSKEDSEVGQYIPLEKPYQEGYFFTLDIDETQIRKLPEEVEAHLRLIKDYVVNEFVSMEKRPAWKKHWDVIDDIIHYPKGKKDKSERIGHFFTWFNLRMNNDGSFLIDSFHKKPDREFFDKNIKPYMSLEIHERLDWRGELVKDRYYTLDKKWHKYFQFRRYDRMITHKYVLNGEKIARTDYLNKKLWERTKDTFGLRWKYDEKVQSNDDRWDSGLQHKRAKVYLEQDMREYKNE